MVVKNKLIFFNSKLFSLLSYIVLIVMLAIYSYSQVDLNLTLASHPYYQNFQKTLTQLGYYQRNISTLIYIILVISLTLNYFWLIYQSKIGQFKLSNMIKVVLIVSFVLTIAYPAFSHDIFNYIFDARILVEHQKNPYLHTALDFPDDLWTRFMRWTHRTYPYGPTWLPISILFYLLGIGKFTLTLISFKFLSLLSFLLGGYGLYRLLKIYSPTSATLGLTLYLFNPVILIEGLLSAHLDMTMAGLMLLGLSFILTQKKIVGWGLLVVSFGIKYTSAAIIPGVILFQKKRISFSQFAKICLILSYLLTMIIISQREILPWYFIVPFSLTALIPSNRIATSLMFSLIPATLVRYAPYLYIGEYTPWVLQVRNLATLIIGVGIFIFMYRINLTQKNAR